MNKPIGPKEAAQRAMREARFEQQRQIEVGIRKAAAAGKEVLERKVKEASERIKNKPAKKRGKKK